MKQGKIFNGKIAQISHIHDLLARQDSLRNSTLQGLDLSALQIPWQTLDLHGALFLGCTFASVAEEGLIRQRGGAIFPTFDDLPYNPYRSSLYTWQELMEGYDPASDVSLDLRIYEHFRAHGRYNPDIREALAQRIHDHAIDEALRDLLEFNTAGMSQKKGVGFMGGHGVLRSDPYYQKVAQTAQMLARAGYLIISGGGPGIMEAANLGAYLAGYTREELREAVQILAQAPYFEHPRHFAQSKAVLARFPNGHESLAVPTWFYGHEPSNLFASQIAKYFSNSIREDGLLAISLFGIVYAPGSAGTTQEIFMDATQNHYGSFGYYSPMIFFGRQRYLKETFIYPLVQQLAWGKKYAELLCLTDSPDEVIAFIQQHPPIKAM